MKWWRRLLGGWREVQEPFDYDYPDSDPAISDDCIDCPDTQPISPGALDTLPGRLE